MIGMEGVSDTEHHRRGWAPEAEDKGRRQRHGDLSKDRRERELWFTLWYLISYKTEMLPFAPSLKCKTISTQRGADHISHGLSTRGQNKAAQTANSPA